MGIGLGFVLLLVGAICNPELPKYLFFPGPVGAVS